MTNRTAAARYARALFDVSREQGDPERVDRDLRSLRAIFEGHPTLASALRNPAVSPVRKRAVVEAILAKLPDLDPIVARLALMLAERDRLTLLPDILDVFGMRLMDHLGVVRARITTAEPLDEARLAAISRSLATATSRQVTVEATTDASLLGGMVTQIGSTVFDGSLAHHLERLRHRFMTGA